MVSVKTLIDSNVIIDVINDTDYADAVIAMLRSESMADRSAVNPIVWSEVAPEFANGDDQQRFFSDLNLARVDLPFEAAREAGIAHFRYRQAGGTRTRTLPDFLIGAHAAVAGYAILTRDVAVYRHYFPGVELLVPGGEIR